MVAALVVAELHEVARQAGADARLEVVAAGAELLDVGRVALVVAELVSPIAAAAVVTSPSCTRWRWSPSSWSPSSWSRWR